MGRNRFEGTLALAVVCFIVLGTLPGAKSHVRAEQPSTAAVPRPVALKPGQVDVQKSRAFAKVARTGFGHDHAIEGRLKEGAVHLGAQQNAGALVFDMTSYRADTAAARTYIGLTGTTTASTQRQTTANMLGASVLNARAFPTSTFVIDSALPIQDKSRDGHPQYKLTGRFTLHGTTRPLSVIAEVVQEQDRFHLRGGFHINQTDFGIEPFKKALGAVGVANQMVIYGEIYVAYEMPTNEQTTPVTQALSTDARR